MLQKLITAAVDAPRTSAIAHDLIDEFGSLPALLSARPEEMMRVAGATSELADQLLLVRAVAMRLLESRVETAPVLRNWRALLDYLHADMAHGLTERFRVLFLNGKNVLIRDEVMGEGTVNTAPVYTREVIKRALELGATALILVHNHPSGDPKPSRDDIAMTQEIAAAARPLGIAVHDHLVIGRKGHASFKALGLL